MPLEESPLEEPIIPMLHPAPYMGPQMIPSMMYPLSSHITEVPVTMNQCNPVPVMAPYGHMPYYYTPIPSPYVIPTPVYAPLKHPGSLPINGYPPIPQYRYPAVPTGQLIELDAYENGDKYINNIEERSHRKSRSQADHPTRYTVKSGFSDISSSSIPRSDTQPALSKAREDGMGTYESWDYVFRNLSSKDRDERGRFSPSLDRDSRTLDRFDRDERRSKYQPATLDLEDGLQALNLDRSYDDELYRTAKVNENLMRMKQESEMKKAKQLAKKQAGEERQRKKNIAPEGNPICEDLINTKIPQDKIRLLSKKDVKDRKEVIKQQSSLINGSSKPSPAEGKKVRKPSKSSADLDRPVKLKSVENGVGDVVIVPKSAPGNYYYEFY